MMVRYPLAVARWVAAACLVASAACSDSSGDSSSPGALDGGPGDTLDAAASDTQAVEVAAPDLGTPPDTTLDDTQDPLPDAQPDPDGADDDTALSDTDGADTPLSDTVESDTNDAGQPPTDLGPGAPEAPIVVITAPVQGNTVEGQLVFEATAEHTSGWVDRVAFRWLDVGVAACEDATAKTSGSTFSCAASVAGLSPGSHSLVAVAHAGDVYALSPIAVVTVTSALAPGTVLLTGVVIPPTGKAAADYDVGNRYGASDVAVDGAFSLPMRAAGVTLTIAEPLGGAEAHTNVLLALTALTPGASSGGAPLVLSAESTAAALLFMHPAFAQGSPAAAATLLELAPQLPSVSALAAKIQSTFGSLATPLSDPAFIGLYDTAVLELRQHLPAPALGSPTGGPIGSLGKLSWHALDHFRQLNLDYDATVGTLTVMSDVGMPLGSFFRFDEIDLSQHGATSALPLLSAADFDRLSNRRSCTPGVSVYPAFHVKDGKTQRGWVNADSLYTYLDLFGNLTAFVTDTLLALVFGPDDGEAADNQVALSPSKAGAYVLRAFNGKLHTGAECGELEAVAAAYADEHRDALVLNAVLVVTDYFGLFVDMEPYVDSCVASIRAVTASVAADLDATPLADGSPSPSTVDRVFTAIGNALSLTAECVAGGLTDDLSSPDLPSGVAKVLKKGKKLIRVADELGFQTAWSKLDALFDALGTVSAVGAILDRIGALIGGPGVSVSSAFTSPMDTVLLRVGDPFSPTIVDVARSGEPPHTLESVQAGQLLIRPGIDSLVLTGEGLRAPPSTPGKTGLRFTDRSGRHRIVQGSLSGGGAGSPPTTLSVLVPTGLAGVVRVEVLHPGRGADLGEILALDPVVTSVSPGSTFQPVLDVGGAWDPSVRISGAGFDPHTFSVRLGDTVVPIDEGASSTTVLVVHVEPTTPAGTHPVGLAIPPGQSPAFSAEYPDGVVYPSGVTLRVNGPPVVTGINPVAIAGGERFEVLGQGFGEQREALRLYMDDAGKTVNTLHHVEDLGDSSRLTATLSRTLSLPFPESLPLVLRTPAGEASFTVPIGEDAWPVHARTVTVTAPGGWDTGWAFVEGFAQPGGSFSRAPDPEYPDQCSCVPNPGLYEWSYDIGFSPTPPVTVTQPPGRAGDGCCASTCVYDSPTSTNVLLGLPTSPCPNTWQGLGAADIRDTLNNQPGASHLPPHTVTQTQWLTAGISAATGGGLVFQGLQGKRTHLTVNLTVQQVTLSGTDTALTLEDVDGAFVTVNLLDADPNECATGIKLARSRNVLLVGNVSGCRVGVDIDAESSNITLSGSYTNYGPGGVGVRLYGTQQVGAAALVTRARALTDLSGFPAGAPDAIAEDAVGVLIDGGAKDVSLFFSDCTSNAAGVWVGAAERVTVMGRIGAPAPFGGFGPADPRIGNHVGVHVVGPALDVAIGGDPLQGKKITLPGGANLADQITVIANNGRLTTDGGGVVAGQVAGLVIRDAYVGLAPGFADGAGNSVGVRLVADDVSAPADVQIRGNHFGQNLQADLYADGLQAGLLVSNNLFAGPPTAGWNAQPPLPTPAPALEGAPCLNGQLSPTGAPTVTTGYGASAPESAALWLHDCGDVVVADVRVLGGGLLLDGCASVDVLRLTSAGAIGPGVRVVRSTNVTLDGLNTWGNSGPGVELEASPEVALGGCLAHNHGAGLEVHGVPNDLGEVHAGRRPNHVASVVQPLAGSRWAPLTPRVPADALHTVIAGNTSHGVYVHHGATPFELTGAAIGGNAGDGVHIQAYDAMVAITSSHIGAMSLPGALAEPNAGSGVAVHESAGPIRIGGAGLGNVISGNQGDGVRADGAPDLQLQANVIGLDAAGHVAVPNGGAGIALLSAAGALVGGPAAEDANLVSGNTEEGILVDGQAPGDGVTLRGNYVGADASASVALGNGGAGIRVVGCDAQAVAPQVLANLLLGNGLGGIVVWDCAAPLAVRDNAVGAGNPALPNGAPALLPNGGAGVELQDCEQLAVSGNEIWGGTQEPALALTAVRSSVLTGNVVYGGAVGVTLHTSHGNQLFHNVIQGGQQGVHIAVGDHNTLRGNRISDHSGAGIVLVAGGNDGIPAPTVLAATQDAGGTWSFLGAVGAAVPDRSLVELFADADDEGRIPLGLATVVHGQWLLRGVAEPPPATLAPASALSELGFHATVTDPMGNTSAFGAQTLPPGTALGTPACQPPPEGPTLPSPELLQRVVTSRANGLYATPLAGGASDALAGLTPGGTATVCGSLVVFSAGAEGQHALYVADVNAQSVTPLTTDAGDHVEPSFSADCAAVVYASNRSGAWDLYVQGVSGGSALQVTNDEAEDRSPSFGPTGGRIALSRREPGAPDFGLYTVLPVAGAEPTLLLDSPGDERDPAWHPSGDRLAFVRCHGTLCGLWQLLVDPDAPTLAGVEVSSTSDGCLDRHPTWFVAGSTSYVVLERGPPSAAPRVVIASDLGYSLWGVTEPTGGDHAPACCLPAAP